MADLQKTIKGLRCHSEPKFGPDEYFCETCPYDEATCGLDVPNDALSLLKAQESRLITKDDFVNADAWGTIPAWIEYNPAIKDAEPCWKIIDSDALNSPFTKAWTSRPTDEQREATPWEN
ncbi:MAG: hypothetical protein IKN04_09045 [Clostridia bacterium]|nr:hypothetical protein [Clostridia bacterium]